MSGSRTWVVLLTVMGIAFGAVSPHRVLAQAMRLDDERRSLDDLDIETVPTPRGTVRTPRTAFDAPVDPETYLLGPSDIVSVNLWISPPASFTLTVTPEGTLIIPTVGEVHVEGIPLADSVVDSDRSTPP